MNRLLRSAALLTASALTVIAAHAAPVTYSGTVTLTDTTTGKNIGSFANSGAFSFTDPGTGTVINPFVDNFNIEGAISDNDKISLNVTFSAPGSGSGALAGEDFVGLFSGNNIDWAFPALSQINLTNGSIADAYLPSFFGVASTSLSSHSCARGEVCGSSDLSIIVTDNDPPLAAPTPEPSSLMLLGTGVLGAAGMIRRKLAV